MQNITAHILKEQWPFKCPAFVGSPATYCSTMFQKLSCLFQVDHKFNLQNIDDKIENSSGYGSEDYSPVSESRQMTIRIEKSRPELGLLLEATKKERRGVQIKTIEVSMVQ